MQIGEFLADVYTKLENAWYDFVEFLAEKGIPADKYNDFLEDRGIPAFPFTIGIIVGLIVLIIALQISQTGISQPVIFSIKDNFGKPLTNVKISLVDEKGKLIKELGEFSDGAETEFSGLFPGAKIYLLAKKEGYRPYITSFTATNELNYVSFELEAERGIINARLKLVDSETKQVIVKENIVAEAIFGYAEEMQSRKGYLDEEGILTFRGIPINEDISIKISSDAYEEFSATMRFDSENIQTIELVPKAAAFENAEVSLKVFVYDEETQQELKNLKIKVLQQDNAAIVDTVADSGFVAKIPYGATIKLIVEKDSYVKYEDEIFYTIRSDREEKIYLRKGGKKLNVYVADTTGMPLSNVNVFLYVTSPYEEPSILDKKTTGFDGRVLFENLDFNKEYYVCANLSGLLPKCEKADLKVSEEINLVLERATMQNTAAVVIRVKDYSAKLIAGAKIHLFEITEKELIIPLGIPPKETNGNGELALELPLGKEILAKAYWQLLDGEAKFKVTKKLKEVEITLEKSDKVKELIFKDLKGDILDGEVVIESPTGELITKGNTDNGRFFFNAENYDFVVVKFKDKEGKEYTHEMNVKGKKDLIFRVTKGKAELAPEIQFLGIETLNGVEIPGLEVSKEAYLIFSIIFPENIDKGGVHIRVGSDNIKFAEEEAVAIKGFLAKADDFRYGRTYYAKDNAIAIDMQNLGKAGARNKWLELYFNNPKGEHIIKVKVRTYSALEDEIEIHFRTFGIIDNLTYRNPKDETLGLKDTTNEKAWLYAETFVEKIKIFESLSLCEKGLCTEFKFINEEGTFKPEEFSCVANKPNALEISLKSNKATAATISLSSKKEPIVVSFGSYEIDKFTELKMPQAENPQQKISLQLEALKEKKVRVYFKCNAAASGFIKAKIVAADTSISKEFAFEILEEKPMKVSFSSKVLRNETFNALITDQLGNAITDAKISIFSSTEKVLLKEVIGNNTLNRGLNGKYAFNVNLLPGTYIIRFKAKGYKLFESTLVVGTEGIIKIPSELKVKLSSKEKKKSVPIEIENLTEEQITNVGYEITKGMFDERFKVSIKGSERIPPKGKIVAILNVEFTEEAEEFASADIKLKVSGTVSNYYTKSETQISLSYNEKIDPKCLVFTPEKLEAVIIATRDLKQNIREVEFTAKNNCDSAVYLTPIFSRSRYLQLEAESIQLNPGEERKFIITIKPTMNLIVEGVRDEEVLRIKFASPRVAKELTLFAKFWKPEFALEYPSFLEINLAQPSPHETAVVGQEIFIRNAGIAAIENIQLSVKPKSVSGITFSIYPSSLEFPPMIKPNELLMPSPILEIKSTKLKSQDIVAELTITGNVHKKKFVLGKTKILVHASAPSCVKVLEKGFTFKSNVISGMEGKELTIVNYCSEEVRIANISYPDIGKNSLVLKPLGSNIIAPGSEAKFILELHRREPLPKFEGFFFVNALLIRSNIWQRSDPIPLKIQLSLKAAFEGVSTAAIRVPMCEDMKQTIEVSFPKFSEDCSNGYCDAVQLSEFIAEKILKIVKKVEAQARKANKEAANVPGLGNYRSFAALGVSEESFDVYLMHDVLTPQLLEHIISKRNSLAKLRRFMVDYASYQTYLGLRGTTYGNKILLDAENKFYGCGYYNVEITGSVPVWYGKLLTEQMLIFVKIGRRQITDECTMDKIQNIMNFLPVDKGLSTERNYRTWLATVLMPVDELEGKLAKLFAKKLLRDEKRVSSFRGGNNIEVSIGKVKYGMLMQLQFIKFNNEEPAAIKVIVNEALTKGKLKSEDIVKEAAYALRSLMDQTLSNGCISKNFSYMLLSTPKKKLEVFKFTPKEIKDFRVYMRKENCKKFKIISNIKQNIKVYIKPKVKEWILKNGAESINILLNGKILQPQQEIILTDKDYNPKTENYIKELKICIKGSHKVFNLHKQKFKIFASGIKLVKDQSIEVNLSSCVINPYHMFIQILQKTPTKKAMEFYAALDWAGEEETVKIEKLIEVLGEEGKLAGKIVNLKRKEDSAVENKITLGREIAKEQAKSTYLWGVGAYLGACSVASGLCNAILGLGAIFTTILDCGLPAVWLASKAFASTKALTDWIEEKFGAVFGWLWEKVAGIVSKTEKGKTIVNATEKVFKENIGKDEKRIMSAASVGIGAEALREVIRGVRGRLTKRMAKKIAKKLADKAAEGMIKEGLGIGAEKAITLKNALKESLEENLRKALLERVGEKLTKESLEEVVEESTKAVASKKMPRALVKVSEELKTTLGFEDLKKNFAKARAREQIESITKEISEELGEKASAQDIIKAANSRLKLRKVSTISFNDLGARTPNVKMNVKVAVRDALTNKYDEFKELIEKQIKDTDVWERVGKEAADEATKKAGYIADEAAEATAKKFTKLKSVVKGLAKGIFCGAVSNAAGYGAWWGYWKCKGTELKNVFNINTEKMAQLERQEVYKIIIRKKDGNSYDLAFKKLNKEEIEKIPKDAEWIEDCTGKSIELNALGKKLEE